MYKFTALLNIKDKVAYLSGNNNCKGNLTLNEMYEIARLPNDDPDSDYSQWAKKIDQAGEESFEFCVFYGESKNEVKNRADRYSEAMGCNTSIYTGGRVTKATDRI